MHIAEFCKTCCGVSEPSIQEPPSVFRCMSKACCHDLARLEESIEKSENYWY